MSVYYSLCLAQLFHHVESVCNDAPIDLNTATLSELDSLPYVSASSAQLITDLRPICSPLELTMSPKKISGITENRLNNNWDWYSDQSCDVSCCRADASCTSPTTPTPTPSAEYAWQTDSWSVCSETCHTGTQSRSVTCFNSTHTVPNTFCLSLAEPMPVNRQVCHTQQCPVYEWVASEWDMCTAVNNECVQTRTITCYETVFNTLESNGMCTAAEELDTFQPCDSCTKVSTANTETTDIDNDISVDIDLLHAYNEEQCQTGSYRNIKYDSPLNRTLITRRSCAVDIWVFIKGKTDNTPIDIAWFYLTATLQANVEESVGDLWNDNYVSWFPNNASSGWITITLPSDGSIGEFQCDLYYQHNGVVNERMQVSMFRLYVLFNPYSSADDVYLSSVTNRNEYIENEVGLIWQGLSDNNSGFKWVFDQFNFDNLHISMQLLNRLPLQYRSDIVLVSRQISYAVGEDICYGKWGSGSYTTGRPSGGYYCSKTKQNCRDPSTWRGTTDIFDLYREVLDSAYSVQYCQCFVYAGIVTTVGRTLGIPTRPISNFQSAHDTDFNRGIEKYWVFDETSKVYEPSDSGASSDSIWSFHVWNEMYFQRTDFDSAQYNVRGWQAIDATPQEYSYGGNPALANDETGAYQMGPAALALIKDNNNPFQCRYAPANQERFGCFDNEFVISEVNANYNFWYKQSTDASEVKFKLLDSFLLDPWGDSYGTIGQQISTKKPGKISEHCLSEVISDCSKELLDITSLYKDTEPSNPSTPTDTTNYYNTPGQERNRRRRRTLSLNDIFGYLNDESLDIEGITYQIDEKPKLYDLNGMIVADSKDEIMYLYDNDYTFGMMEINIDSYFDEILYVYCAFMVTAHDYSGQRIYLNNETGMVKNETNNFILNGGESDKCSFAVIYEEYQDWVLFDDDTDISDIPYVFKLTLSVSIFENDTAIEPLQSIIEQNDVLVCVPIYRLRDRIVCQNGLKWFEPSHDLEYTCEGSNIVVESVGDGFCDDGNNIEACFDGGDCCRSSCVASDQYFCEYFDCVDGRVNQPFIDYFQCHEPVSFINYMNKLLNLTICVDADTSIVQPNFVCSHEIWTSNTGNECVDYVSGANGVFGEIQSCFNETFHSLETEMQQIIDVVIDCMDIQESLDNDTYTPSTQDNDTTTTELAISTLSTTEFADSAPFKAMICNFAAGIWFIFWIFTAV